MGKKNSIIISETQLITLVGDFITEQQDLGNKKPPPPLPPPNSPPIPQQQIQRVPPSSLPPTTFGCLPNRSFVVAVETALGEGSHPLLVRHGLGILGRESNYGKILGKYGAVSGTEYVINKASQLSPTFATIVKWGAKTVLNKDNWIPSMGIAQMKPTVAKEYNIDLEELMTFTGSLLATTRHLTVLYNQMSKYYDTNKPTIILNKSQLLINPSSSGNAALDAAILSYNLGPQRLKRSYCQTSSPDLLAPCNSSDVYQPYPNDKPNFKVNVYKDKIVKNYLPNIRTTTGSLIDKGLDKMGVKDNNNYISTLGYVKEVVNRAKSFRCVR